MGQFSGMELNENTYADTFRCPRCGRERDIVRLRTSANREINTWCGNCRDNVRVMAGPVPGQELQPLPCPFCRREKVVVNGDGELVWLDCVGCGATGPPAEGKTRAIILWNRRS